ncbi:MAG: hypothetical protein U5L01_17395 [Rheinheimera sp.]|nr:hypothetical protein [Rheinheimera sp.]
MRKVVIFGCGWLGQQLGVALAAAGYQVFGTRQSAQSCALLPESIHPVVLQLPVVEFPFALVADAIVIVALPASTPNYLAALRQISDSCAKASQIFFCSSTGIYAGLTGHLTEAALPLPTALLELAAGSLATDYAQAIMAAKNPAALVQLSRVQRLLAAEIIMCQLENVVILRLAGLIGPGRHPANFTRHGALAGADLPVNMLHSYDIQRFLIWLRQPESSLVVNGVVNLCSPEHPTKQQFYQQLSGCLRRYLRSRIKRLLAKSRVPSTLVAVLLYRDLVIGLSHQFQQLLIVSAKNG